MNGQLQSQTQGGGSGRPMQLRIRHVTGFTYDEGAAASYNEARLTPQTGPAQLTLESRVETSPPARQQRYWDYWGTQVTSFDLSTPHRELEVTAVSVVETGDPQPPVDGVTWADLATVEIRDRHTEMLEFTGYVGRDKELAKVAPAGVDVKRFEDNNATIAAFVAGQTQLVATSASVAGNMMAKNPGVGAEFKLLLKDSPNFIGVAKGEDKLRTRVNDILAEAKKSGELDALSKKWLGRPAGDLPS